MAQPTGFSNAREFEELLLGFMIRSRQYSESGEQKLSVPIAAW